MAREERVSRAGPAPLPGGPGAGSSGPSQAASGGALRSSPRIAPPHPVENFVARHLTTAVPAAPPSSAQTGQKLAPPMASRRRAVKRKRKEVTLTGYGGRAKSVMARLLTLGLVLTDLQAAAVTMRTQLEYVLSLEYFLGFLMLAKAPLNWGAGDWHSAALE